MQHVDEVLQGDCLSDRRPENDNQGARQILGVGILLHHDLKVDGDIGRRLDVVRGIKLSGFQRPRLGPQPPPECSVRRLETHPQPHRARYVQDGFE